MHFTKVLSAVTLLSLGCFTSAQSTDSHFSNLLAARDELIEAQNNYLFARDLYETIEGSLYARDLDSDSDIGTLFRRGLGDEISGSSGIAQARHHAAKQKEAQNHFESQHRTPDLVGKHTGKDTRPVSRTSGWSARAEGHQAPYSGDHRSEGRGSKSLREYRESH